MEDDVDVWRYAICMPETTTDYRGLCRTLLTVQDINLEAYAANNPATQIIRSDWELNPQTMSVTVVRQRIQ